MRGDGEMDDALATVALHLVPGLGPGWIGMLLARFGSARAALEARPDAIRAKGVPAEVAERVLRADLAAARVEVERATSLGARVLWRGGPGYPSLLEEIPLPPPVLYCRGDPAALGAETPAVAVVGTRTPTGYGRETAYRIAVGMAQAGVRVVSGLARGIDSAAHRGALDGGGETVAILGCGLDVSFSGEEPGLPGRIEEAGAVLTEFALGAPARRGHFPRRNRLISGLARGVVVVEAAERSGSLLTAQWALDQGREVLAVPGRVDNPMARGTNGLIRGGAALVGSAVDVLEAIGLRREERLPPGRSDALLGLLEGPGKTLDELVAATGRSPEDLLEALLPLEIAGAVVRAPGGIYRRLGREAGAP